MSWTVDQIAKLLDGRVVGDGNKKIQSISPLNTAGKDDLSFLSNPKYKHLVPNTQAGAIIIDSEYEMSEDTEMTFIIVQDPYASITLLHTEFERRKSQLKTGWEDPVFIGEKSKIGSDVYLGAFSYIGKGVTIGNGVKIHPHVHIGDHTVIGDHTIIYPGVKIYSQSAIGKYCTIQAGAVIGSHGFGYAPQPDGSYQGIPQAGNVKLEDHVDIGANTTIDCATFGTTLIEKGVKIDNLVQIGHNVMIGRDTVIAAQTGISGSTTIGKNVMIGGQVGTVGHIHIADSTKVGARSGVTKSTKSDQILFGVPAMDRHEYLKSYAVYKKLPELMRRIEELERNPLV